MYEFIIGFVGAWVGAITMAAVLYGIYLYEVYKREKAAKALGDELKSLLASGLAQARSVVSGSKDNKFN